jgi:energy-coupling factor transport system permease protein
VNLDLYVRRPGWLQRADPRAKFALVVFLTVAFLASDQVAPLLAGLLLTHALALSTGVPARSLAALWRTLWSLTLLILLLSSITWDGAGPALVQLGRFSITPASILAAASLALRVDALAFGFMLLLWTTEQGEMVAGLTRLGLPFGASLAIAIAMQFVPSLARVAGEIMEAQQARGLRVPRRNPIAIGRAYLPVLVPLLITALRMADHLALALEARGYRPGVPRTSRRQLRMAGPDWVIAGAATALAAAAVLSRFLI